MAKDDKRFSNSVNIKNKKARFEFEFIDTLVAGIVLKGTEIKSIREGKACRKRIVISIGARFLSRR